MSRFSWNKSFPGEPAPLPGRIQSADGREVFAPTEFNGFKVRGAVWCDEGSGEVGYVYDDMETAKLELVMPSFVMKFPAPLKVGAA